MCFFLTGRNITIKRNKEEFQKSRIWIGKPPLLCCGWVCYRDTALTAPRLPQGHGGQPARTHTALRPHTLRANTAQSPPASLCSRSHSRARFIPASPSAGPASQVDPAPQSFGEACPGEGPGTGRRYWGSSRPHKGPRFSSRPTSVPRRPQRRSLTGSSRLTKSSGLRGPDLLGRRNTAGGYR